MPTYGGEEMEERAIKLACFDHDPLSIFKAAVSDQVCFIRVNRSSDKAPHGHIGLVQEVRDDGCCSGLSMGPSHANYLLTLTYGTKNPCPCPYQPALFFDKLEQWVTLVNCRGVNDQYFIYYFIG